MKEIKVTYKNLSRITGLSLPVIRMEFLNKGIIEVSNEHGGYVIASGCGSGKTTIIKQLIKDLSIEGILYSANTIEECNEMFNYCIDLIENNKINRFGIDDIILLHSGDCPNPKYINEFNEWRNIYKNNSEEIQKKQIIICTHHKLFNTEPVTFIGYKGNPIVYETDDVSPIELAVTSRCESTIYYPRQLILIDELPTCNTLKVQVDPVIIRAMGEVRSEVYYDESEPDPKKRYKSRMYNPKTIDKPEKFRYLMNNYNTELLGSRHELIKVSDDKSKRVLRFLEGLIYDNYYEYIKGNDLITINYNISDFVMDRKMQTRILLFEGTGDLTFKDSKRFRLLTFNNKYSSKINIEKFDYDISRKQKSNISEDEITNRLNKIVDTLSNIISRNSRTLIVTWMNFKESDGNISSGNLVIKNSVFNEDFNLPEYYKSELTKRNIISGYEIIHYMSGLDKATNKFRDYDAVIFLGNFRVPNYVVSEFNRDYRVNSNPDSYTLYQLVQAACRTKIRMHNSNDSVNIYFSNDWDNNVIELFKDYISNNEVLIKSSNSEVMELIKPKWRNAISILCSYDPKLEDSLKYGTAYWMDIDLSILYSLIPLKEKQVRSYYPLINYLRKFNIELTINSNSNYKGKGV